MRKLISFALQRPEIPLGLALLILLTFTILVAFPAPRNWSAGLLLRSVQTTLTLMLAIDSPANLLQNRSPALVALGWLVCLMGWLLLPLLVGVMVDVTLSRAESYSKLRTMFRELGEGASLDGKNLEKFTEAMMQKAAKLILGKTEK